MAGNDQCSSMFVYNDGGLPYTLQSVLWQCSNKYLYIQFLRDFLLILSYYVDQNARQRPVISMKLRADHALLNHVFQTELDIQDTSRCLAMCALTSECQSFNYSDEEKICELNSSTKQKHPEDFLARKGFGYFMKGTGVANTRYVEDF